MFRLIFSLTSVLLLFIAVSAPAQQLAKRLILKDGSYQLATKYEIKGDRVRYLSAERGEWEELPKSMVDWAATEKYENDRTAGSAFPEVRDLDKELEAERKAEEAKYPEVAPGLRLSDDNAIFLLDVFQNEPQLVDLQQSSGQLNRNRKENILRGAINPVASAKQTIELAGLHAKVQAHSTLPAIYVNVAPEQDSAAPASQPQQPELPWDRFRIVRVQSKQGKRIVGAVKISVIGKTSQEQSLIPSRSEQITGGWVKVTPSEELAPGEYALVEMLGKEGMNLYVWDFGVNPAAPANSSVRRPEASAMKKSDTQAKPIEQR